jgi:hypothetical protein
LTATAATNGKQRLSAAANNTRTIRPNWGYVRPEKRKAGFDPIAAHSYLLANALSSGKRGEGYLRIVRLSLAARRDGN